MQKGCVLTTLALRMEHGCQTVWAAEPSSSAHAATCTIVGICHVRATRNVQVSGHPAIAPHMERFYGVRNGIDQDAWDPMTDRFLPRYGLLLTKLLMERYWEKLCCPWPSRANPLAHFAVYMATCYW